MPGLKIDIDKNSGFCFGVIYAIEMAETILEEKGYLYCLHDIVHNDEEVERLKQKGLKIIDHTTLLSLFNEPVLIRAHGEPPSTYQTAVANNLTLIDASCPVVLKLQNRIKRSYDKGKPVYIFGKEGHAEVIGLKGQTNNEAVVFASHEEIAHTAMPASIVLYSQTTKSTTELYRVKKLIEEAGTQVELNDTICRQVSNREEELKLFATAYDLVIFVAGEKSSNGKMLYKACKEANADTHFVSGVKDIQPEWLLPGASVGICGATSTPMWLMEQIRDAILNVQKK